MEQVLQVLKKEGRYFRIKTRHVTPEDYNIVIGNKEYHKDLNDVIDGAMVSIKLNLKPEINENLSGIFLKYKYEEKNEVEELLKLIKIISNTPFSCDDYKESSITRYTRNIKCNKITKEYVRIERANIAYLELTSHEYIQNRIKNHCDVINCKMDRYQQEFDKEFERFYVDYFTDYGGPVCTEWLDKEAKVEAEEKQIKELKAVIEDTKEVMRIKRLNVMKIEFEKEKDDSLKGETDLISMIETKLKDDPKCMQENGFFHSRIRY
jgi:aspartyl aminopeptidase